MRLLKPQTAFIGLFIFIQLSIQIEGLKILRVNMHNRQLHKAVSNIENQDPSFTSLSASTSELSIDASDNRLVLPVKSLKYEKIFKQLELFSYLSIWYALSAVYNIYNKKALNILNLPWFVATVQMGTGLLLFIPMWILKIRESPAQNFGQLIEVFGYMKSVAFFQTLTHISGVIALGSGAVSFTQVVKASEPVFTAVISAVFLKQYLAWQVYVSLLPICIGVAVASTTELSFSWYCLLAGVIANVFSAARGVFGKTQMCGETSCLEQLSPENYYAVLTILSFSMLIPASFLVESNQISIMLKSAFSYFINNVISTGISQLSMSENVVSKLNFEGVLYTLFSGLLFYLYNEVSFRTLNKVHPVTHAISNTVKRVVIILSSVIVFNNKMTFNSIAGTVLSMAGVFVYSIAQYVYSPKTKKEN
jgi:solute carrier family 35 protein E1